MIWISSMLFAALMHGELMLRFLKYLHLHSWKSAVLVLEGGVKIFSACFPILNEISRTGELTHYSECFKGHFSTFYQNLRHWSHSIQDLSWNILLLLMQNVKVLDYTLKNNNKFKHMRPNIVFKAKRFRIMFVLLFDNL